MVLLRLWLPVKHVLVLFVRLGGGEDVADEAGVPWATHPHGGAGLPPAHPGHPRPAAHALRPLQLPPGHRQEDYPRGH